MTDRLRRIKKEIQSCQEGSSQLTVYCEPIGDTIEALKGFLLGPEGTPYEGGSFVVDMKLPPDYPFMPPMVSFETKIWHPNISSETGAICLDILKKEWTPVLSLKTVLMSLQALLQSPEPEDPQDTVVANQLLSDPKAFEQQAKSWTEKSEKAFGKVLEQTEQRDKVKRLLDMGFDERRVRLHLLIKDLDENRALDALLQ